MEWYYSNSGVQSGPVSIEVLRAKVASGEVLGADLVWRDGMSDWMPASAVPELSTMGVAGVPNGVAGAQVYPMGPQTPGLAIASLVCGLVGMLGFFACWIPGLVGIGGIICGHMALKKIKSNETQYNGKGLAIGGLVTGYISVVFLIVATIFLIGVFVISKRTSDDFTKELSALENEVQMAEEATEVPLEVEPPAEIPVEPPAETEQ